MYAVLRLGSHQYLVSPGQIVTVEKLDGPVGSKVTFKDILALSDGKDMKLGKEATGLVMGIIKAQERGRKILVFKKKRRKGYQKMQGHRQGYTRVEITGIEV